MSKHTNYGSFYKKDEREEVQATEEAVEAVQEAPKKEEPKVEEPPKPIKIYTTVLGPKKVNMRFKPNKSGQVINILPPGARVEVLDQSNPEWTKIRYKDIVGYMMSEFLKKE